MTILLIGANGQLGSELRHAFKDHDLVPLVHTYMEFTDPAQVRNALRKYRPGLILNTAAYHRVDECEEYPERSSAILLCRWSCFLTLTYLSIRVLLEVMVSCARRLN